MPVTVTVAPAAGTVTAAGRTIEVTTDQDGVWSLSYLDRHLTAPSLPALQAEITRLERTAWTVPDQRATVTSARVPATLRLGREGRSTFEDITVVGYAAVDGLEVIRGNGRRDVVPEERVYVPLDAGRRADLLRLQAQHIATGAHLDAVQESAARIWDVEGTVTVVYDHGNHAWTATARHGDQEYGPFEERHAADASWMAQVALFAAQFPWTVEPTGTGVNPAVTATLTESISSAPSYRTREDAERHVAAHRAHRAARRALGEFHEEYRFQPAAHFPMPSGKVPDGEGRPV